MAIENMTELEIFDLLKAKKIEYCPWYTDESLTDGGIGILRTIAHVSKLLIDRANNCLKEAYLSTANLAQSVFNIADTLNYTLSPAKAARILLTFISTGSATIPVGTKVKRPKSEGFDEVIFETDEALVFTVAGSKEVYATNGETYSDLFTSTGAKSQEFGLSYKPYIYGSISVVVDGMSETWTQVDDFLESEEDDCHFVVAIDSDDNVTVKFGDGFNGRIPTEGHEITVEYKVGGGDIGNVGKGTVTQMLTSVPGISSVTNGPVSETALTEDCVAGATSITVGDTAGFMTSGSAYIEGDQFSYTGKTDTSFTGCAGISIAHVSGANVWLQQLGNRGVDKETVEQAKWRIPASLKSMRRAVSLSDYERVVLNEFKYEVAQALAYERAGSVLVAILPTTGGAPTVELIEEVQVYLRKIKMARENVVVTAPTFVYVDCSVEVSLMEFYNFTDEKTKIEEIIYNFLDPVYKTEENLYINKWSRDIFKAQIIRDIYELESIKNVNITVLKRSTASSGCADIVITDKEIVAPGVITVTLAGVRVVRAMPIPAGAMSIRTAFTS